MSTDDEAGANPSGATPDEGSSEGSNDAARDGSSTAPPEPPTPVAPAPVTPPPPITPGPGIPAPSGAGWSVPPVPTAPPGAPPPPPPPYAPGPGYPQFGAPDPQNVSGDAAGAAPGAASGGAPGPAGGGSPYGAPGPYGTPDPATTGPYGSPYGAPGGYPAPGNPYAPLGAEAAGVRNQAIISLVINGLTVLCCNIFGIAGVVVSALALGKVQEDLPRARALVKWSWGLLIVAAALWLLGVVSVFAIGIATDSDSSF